MQTYVYQNDRGLYLTISESDGFGGTRYTVGACSILDHAYVGNDLFNKRVKKQLPFAFDGFFPRKAKVINMISLEE